MPRYTLYVSDEDKAEMDRHPGLNRSALFARALAEYLYNDCQAPDHDHTLTPEPKPSQ